MVSPIITLFAFIIISVFTVVGSKLLQMSLFMVKSVDEVIVFCFPLNRLSTSFLCSCLGLLEVLHSQNLPFI
ncbi:MAG: hypothetical protein ACKPKO_20605 [Candidatus Fonsibacter sp.]